jgi:hypothetical protein
MLVNKEKTMKKYILSLIFLVLIEKNIQASHSKKDQDLSNQIKNQSQSDIALVAAIAVYCQNIASNNEFYVSVDERNYKVMFDKYSVNKRKQ